MDKLTIVKIDNVFKQGLEMLKKHPKNKDLKVIIERLAIILDDYERNIIREQELLK